MPEPVSISSGDLVAVAAIVVGFAVTVIMFRVQRELWVQDRHPKWPNWLAWSDYLIVASAVLAIFAILVVLIAPRLTLTRRAIGAACCSAAIILQAGYIPGILAHYRIEIGTHKTGDREKGEPIERVVVYVSGLFALAVFLIILRSHLVPG